MKKIIRLKTLLVVITCLLASKAMAQDAPAEPEKKVAMEIYGFAMMDAGYDFKQVDPNWFDTMRPTKLPSFKKQFGADGNTYFGVRQSRLGVKGYFPTKFGELK